MARAAVSRIREGQNGCKVRTGIQSIFAAPQLAEADVLIDSLFGAHSVFVGCP
jgi:hypothetical protein